MAASELAAGLAHLVSFRGIIGRWDRMPGGYNGPAVIPKTFVLIVGLLGLATSNPGLVRIRVGSQSCILS